ncbi:MAG TPA: hypothetical protein VES38_08020 [Methylotenera sp.]|nr:hypothetical protein [Methylotenera sp.]
MALNLNIPTLKDKPLIVADTRPQKIALSLLNLDKQNPLETATYLQTELEILNRQKVSVNNRIQALDAYRPLLISTAQALAADYDNATLPLHDKAKLAASAAESLWLELGYGYKLALVDLQNQFIKLGTDKSSAYVIQRAIDALAEYALVCYQTYVTPPDFVWSDLNQLYFCAVQLGIQHLNIQNSKPEISDKLNSNSVVSIENTYKHALLMSLADPQHLAQKDVRLIANLLAFYVADAKLGAVAPLTSSSGAFIISLNSNKPPVPYSKLKEFPDADNDILLQTMMLVRSIHQNLNNLKNGQLPKDGSIPADANRSDYIELLTYLIKHWGVIPKRVFNRSQKNGELELVTGIAAIHQHSDIEHRASKSMPSRWQILNISASGISIRRHPTADKNIKIGSLLGFKTKNEANWSLGLVRWANCGSKDRLDIGVQLIAPQAQSATARIDGRDSDEMVLLLPEIAAVKQAMTIIAPKGTYQPAQQLTLKYNNISQHVMLTKLIERSPQFERMQFSIIS